jgi:hypothetical protein
MATFLFFNLGRYNSVCSAPVVIELYCWLLSCDKKHEEVKKNTVKNK